MNLLLPIIGQRRRAGFDPDAADWFDRILAAGSTISAANKDAGSELFATLRANGYLAGPLVEMGLFAGPDSEAGGLVKAWDGASAGDITKVGTAFNFSRLSGIKSTASATYLESALNLNYSGFGQNNFSMGFYIPETLANNDVRYLSIGGNNNTDMIGGTSIRGRMRSGTLTTGPADTAAGFYAWRRTGSSGGDIVTPGNSGTFSTASSSIVAGNAKIISSFDGLFPQTNRFISFYFFGNASIDLTVMRTAITTYIAALT